MNDPTRRTRKLFTRRLYLLAGGDLVAAGSMGLGTGDYRALHPVEIVAG